ncbi:HTH-type transcriptional regulator AdiY [Kluyvera cryocrescens]|uniref:HTH-type transcriptional regulator AdiY n=1 Tax=Kluyvera cryocrescens TaxID=580 RepID=A0A485CWT9_KLUCR|nr:HTH-type transcriptional regulator AdiY [Kluyvera cryocrescens]
MFREAALHSVLETSDRCEIERTRSLLFTVLSVFVESPGFIALIMQMLRNSVKESVLPDYPERYSKGVEFKSGCQRAVPEPEPVKKEVAE